MKVTIMLVDSTAARADQAIDLAVSPNALEQALAAPFRN